MKEILERVDITTGDMLRPEHISVPAVRIIVGRTYLEPVEGPVPGVQLYRHAVEQVGAARHDSVFADIAQRGIYAGIAHRGADIEVMSHRPACGAENLPYPVGVGRGGRIVFQSVVLRVGLCVHKGGLMPQRLRHILPAVADGDTLSGSCPPGLHDYHSLGGLLAVQHGRRRVLEQLYRLYRRRVDVRKVVDPQAVDYYQRTLSV